MKSKRSAERQARKAAQRAAEDNGASGGKHKPAVKKVKASSRS